MRKLAVGVNADGFCPDGPEFTGMGASCFSYAHPGAGIATAKGVKKLETIFI
jgi:hypothetical protein